MAGSDLSGIFIQRGIFALVFSALVSINYNVRERIRIRSVLILLTFASFIGIMIVQYITWMPLEAPYLGGVQGRYFIPVFPAAALAFSGFQKDIVTKRWQPLFFLFVLIVPFVNSIVLVDQLIGRFY